MKATDVRPDVRALARPARGPDAAPTVGPAQAVELVRRHLDWEKVRSLDFDRDLWTLWQQETRGAAASDRNADVLDRVLARVRVGD